jgi:hypothetical protein
MENNVAEVNTCIDPWICLCEECCGKLSGLSHMDLFVGSSKYIKMDLNEVVSTVNVLLDKFAEISGKANKCAIFVKLFRVLYKNEWYIYYTWKFSNVVRQKLTEYTTHEYYPATIIGKIFLEEFFPLEYLLKNLE